MGESFRAGIFFWLKGALRKEAAKSKFAPGCSLGTRRGGEDNYGMTVEARLVLQGFQDAEDFLKCQLLCGKTMIPEVGRILGRFEHRQIEDDCRFLGFQELHRLTASAENAFGPGITD